MTQNNFVTRKLLIFHKCTTMQAIPAESPMYMDLIQKLPLFVSCIVVLLIQLYLNACTKMTFWLGYKSSLLRKLEEEVTIFDKILPMLSVLFNIYLFIISHVCELQIKMWTCIKAIFTVMNTTWAVVKIRPEINLKTSWLNYLKTTYWLPIS